MSLTPKETLQLFDVMKGTWPSKESLESLKVSSSCLAESFCFSFSSRSPHPSLLSLLFFLVFNLIIIIIVITIITIIIIIIIIRTSLSCCNSIPLRFNAWRRSNAIARWQRLTFQNLDPDNYFLKEKEKEKEKEKQKIITKADARGYEAALKQELKAWADTGHLKEVSWIRRVQ